MSDPIRVQLSRAKGWRMPPNTVKVDRSTRWGNQHDWRGWRYAWPYREISRRFGLAIDESGRDEWCRAQAVEAYRKDIATGAMVPPAAELRGKNLACWCKLPRPGEPDVCHAAVLLELANK